MLTILMAEVFPEIQQNNMLMCHVVKRRQSIKDFWSYAWFFKFLFQAIISHFALLLSIIVILKAQEEFNILNDSIGILVLSSLNVIGSKLLIEDFKIDYNEIYTDGDFLTITVCRDCIEPVHKLMILFRPMFFVMLIFIFYFWPEIFIMTSKIELWMFRIFIVFWISMLLFSLLIMNCYGEKISKFMKKKDKEKPL